MGLQFVIGGAGADKAECMRKCIIEEAVKNRDRKYFILVPEQFTLQTQKATVELHPDGGIMNIDVLSFARLADRVFTELSVKKLTVLQDMGKTLAVKKILLDNEDRLKAFAQNSKKQGFVEEVKSIISEALQYSIDGEKLGKMIELSRDNTLLKYKLEDVKLLFEAFESFLTDRFMTPESMFDVAARALDSSTMLSGAVVWLDEYTGFTPSQYKLLKKLMEQTEKVYMTITMDIRWVGRKIKEHELFYMSFKTMECMERLALEQHTELLKPVLLKNTLKKSEALKKLEEHIFRYPPVVYEDATEALSIVSEENPSAEVNYAAAMVNYLVREKSYRYRDIAIVTGDTEIYGELIGREFKKAGLPVFTDGKKNITANPLVELIRAVLQTADENFSGEGIMRYFKSGLTGDKQEDYEKLENYIYSLGIRGKKAWSLEWTKQPKSAYDFLLKPINELRAKTYERLSKVTGVLTDKRSTVRDRIKALYVFLSEAEAEKQLFELSTKFKSQPDMEIPAKEYSQCFKMVIDIFDRMVELLSEELLTAREFTELLETGFREAKVGVIPQGIDRIIVGDIERTRLKGIKALIFAGVNDGLVPKQKESGGIISDNERSFLCDKGVELAPTNRQEAYTLDYYLYLLLTKPSERLLITYSRVSPEGKAIRPSFLIGRLKRMFPSLKNDREADKLKLDVMLGTDRGLKYFADKLLNGRNRTEELLCSDEFTVWRELLAAYTREEEELQPTIHKIIDAAYYKSNQSDLSPENINKLYGRQILGSISRMESYASCAFAHFISYGLKIADRQEFKIAMPDLGNIYHKALELFSIKLSDNNLSYLSVTDEQREVWGRECVEEAAREYGNGVLVSSKRNEYLIERISRVTGKTLATICAQLRAGGFSSAVYEKSFEYAEDFMRLRGRIDRMDIAVENGKIYVRVIDYKSGHKKFDLNELYYGLQLQLCVYMNEGIRQLKEQYGDSKIHPAGMFYYHVEDPIVEKAENSEALIQKALRLEGLVSSEREAVILQDAGFYSADGGLMPMVDSSVIPAATGKSGELKSSSRAASEEQLLKIIHYASQKLKSLGSEIMEGKTEKNPYALATKTACEYCDYSSICCFDREQEGYRRLKKLTEEEIMAQISDEGEKADD